MLNSDLTDPVGDPRTTSLGVIRSSFLYEVHSYDLEATTTPASFLLLINGTIGLANQCVLAVRVLHETWHQAVNLRLHNAEGDRVDESIRL